MTRLNVVATVAALLLIQSAAAQPSPAELFPSQADITVTSDGLSRLELPAEVLSAVQPDLSDIRLFDAQGNEVPYLLERGRPHLEQFEYRSFEPSVQRVSRRIEELGGRDRSNYFQHLNLRIDPAPPLAGSWQLVVKTAEPEFVRRIDVKTDRPGNRERYYLLENESLFRLRDAQVEQTVFDLPPLTTGNFFVDIEGQTEADGFLPVSFELRQRRSLGARAPSEVELTVANRSDDDNTTVLTVERPRAFDVVALRLGTSSTTFSRNVRVLDPNAGGPDRIIGSGQTIYRLPSSVRVEDLEIDLQPARGNQLLIEVDNGDSPPLADPTVTALTSTPALIFSLPYEGGTLRFGGGRSTQPRYDLAALRAVAGAGEIFSAPTPAQLGPLTANPSFNASPLLSFASRPGAAIDPAVYTHVRQVELRPSDEGLSVLELSMEDAAHARADLADLRLVDGDLSQWAYLLKPNARQEFWDLRVADETSEDGATIYQLAPPSSPALLDQLQFDSEAVPFFDRPYELFAVMEDDTERPIIQGRLSRAANQRGPVEIDFPAIRVKALRLQVFNGNDNPLEGLTVTGRFPLPDLYTVAPAGSYELLMGYPEDRPPVYELAQASATVFAAQAASALPGPFSDNPSFRSTSRLNTGPGSQRVLFWIALLAAVGVLAVMTLKTARTSG